MKLKTIREIHRAFAEKQLSPVELTTEYFQRIQRSRHNAYISLCEERAALQAQRAQEKWERDGSDSLKHMPLLGIPLGIKDVLVTEGVRTTCGSKILENYIPPYTATAVKKLEDAGAIVLGKLNMDEFAMGGSNENSAYGPVEHPTHLGHVPGGSRGGSATAVKAELCVAALGTDTGGSIRLPSSYCGIVGVKPTYGRVSRYGMIAFASSLDQIGPMTQNVEDASLLLEVMAGHDPMDSTSSKKPVGRFAAEIGAPFSWNQIRIGVPKEYESHDLAVSGISKEVAGAVQNALLWLEKKGAQIVSVSLPHTDYSVAIYYLIAVSEASSNLARFDGVRFGTRPPNSEHCKNMMEFYKTVRSLFGAEVKRRIILGTFALSAGYAEAFYQRACQARRLIYQDFKDVFEKVDFVVGPVSPSTAFRRGEKTLDPLKMYLNDILTIPANLAGIPALSLPCGKDLQGLPIGLHWMAPAFQEGRLLRAAQAFEKEFSC